MRGTASAMFEGMGSRFSRLWDAVAHKRRSTTLDITSRYLSGVGILPAREVLRGSLREFEFLEHPEDSFIEFYDGAAITYPSFTQVNSNGVTRVQDRGYPRAAFLYCLHDVIVETRYGIPWNRNRDVLLGVHNGDLEKEAWELWSRNPKISPTIGDLIVMPSTPAFFHWLIEQVPGVLRCVSSSPNAQVVISSDAPKWMLEACHAMQIPVRKHPRGTIRAKRYTAVTRQMQSPLPSDTELLRSSMGISSGDLGSRKLMISRRHATRFSETEARVEAALVQRGFDVICPETLTLLEQVKLFSEAAVVVGSSGAALSNLVWTPENVKVVVLKSDVLSKNFLWNRIGPESADYWNLKVDSLTSEEVVSTVLDIAL